MTKKRREWWIIDPPWCWKVCKIQAWMTKEPKTVHVREVFTDDPDPEWIDKLIQLCDEWAGFVGGPGEQKAEAVREYELICHIEKRRYNKCMREEDGNS